MRRLAYFALGAAFAVPFVACEREVTLVTLPAESGGSPAGGVNSGGAIASGGAAMGGTSTQPSGGSSSGGDGAANSGGATGTSCRDHSDCLTSELCFKNSCGEDTGHCDTPPAACDGTPATSCGCDHITYWNDCLRRHAGVALDRVGDCGQRGKPCSSNDDCGTQDGVQCAHIGYQEQPQPQQQQGGQVGPCGSDLGSCWVVPFNCDNATDTTRWQECNTSGGPPGPDRACVSTCQAITSGRTYFPAQRCP